jgi:hypothetical protein
LFELVTKQAGGTDVMGMDAQFATACEKPQGGVHEPLNVLLGDLISLGPRCERRLKGKTVITIIAVSPHG